MEIFLTRIAIALVGLAIMAGSWDTWWHFAVGRDSLWEPPHLLLYAAAIGVMGSGIYGWYRTRDKLWRRLAILIAIVPLSAPFDELWHRLFGEEEISSPLIVWSPPHMVLILASILTLTILLSLLRRDKDVSARQFFGAIAFGGIAALSLFLVLPLRPIGPNALIEFWGAGIVSAVLVTIMLIAHRWLPGIAGATLSTLFLLVVISMDFESVQKIGSGVIVEPYGIAPIWLRAFAFLAPAVFIDLFGSPSFLLRGAIAGILWGGILYGFSSSFFEPAFQYAFQEGLAAVVSAMAGGMVARIFVSRVQKNPRLTWT